MARYPFVTGTRGLTYRDYPSAFYQIICGKWVPWMGMGCLRDKVSCFTQAGLHVGREVDEL